MKAPLLKLTDIEASPEGHIADQYRGRILNALRTNHNLRFDIEIREHTSQRSLDQNAYWWAVPVALLSEHTGYEPEQMHYVLLGEWRGYMDGPRGEKVPRCCSSSKLTTAEFTELIEWVQRWAVMELDVQIPAPNEWQPAEAMA